MMKLPRQEWYTAEDLGKEWGCSVSKVNHYVEINKLTMSARYLSADGEQWLTGRAEKEYEAEGLIKDGYQLDGEYILLKEVERFEKEHGQESLVKKPDLLKPDFLYFSKELSDAITAWQRTVKKKPESQKFKAMAKEWLEQAGYEGEALERLAIVVNPDKAKKGGAPKKE